MSNEVIMKAPHADPNDPLRYIDSEEVKPSVDAVHDPDPPTISAPLPPMEDELLKETDLLPPKKDNKRKQPEPPVEPRKSKRNRIFSKFFQFESKNEGPGVETNKKKTNKKTQKVPYKPVKNTSRKTNRNTDRNTKKQKTDDNRGSSSLIDSAKNLVKKGVKKVRTLTGTSIKYVKASISQLLNASTANLNLNITATMIKNFLVENKDKLFGMKGKIIRDMIERANSIDQGNSLYGCGSGKTLKPGENSFNWSSSPSDGDDGLVYCWATKVPCAFNLGKVDMAGHGLNHEMEHAVPCVRQFMINCLSQIKNLPDDEESIYRRYHNLLIEILKGYLPSVSEDEDKIIKYVYYIFKMFRRQQVILGLPSISLFNQIKCAINLIDIDFKNENNYLSFRLKPNKEIIKKTAKDMDSKDSKKFNSPCNMIGSKHKDSAFKSKQKLTEYYEGTYKDSRGRPVPALVSKAVKKAIEFAGMTTQKKEKLLMEQCTKICDEYNSLFDGHSKLSSICSACSIVIVTTIMKSTYVELEIDTKTVPELITWSKKAIEFLKSNINYLDNDDVLAHIDAKHADLLAKSQGNVSTVNYLEMNDKTIKDLIDKPEISPIHNMSGGGELSGKLNRASTLLGRQRNERKSNKEGRRSFKNQRRMTIVQNDKQGQKGNRYNSRLSKQQMRNQEYNQSQLLRVVDERLQIKENDYYEVYDEYKSLKIDDKLDDRNLATTMNKFLDLLDCQFTEEEFLDVLIQYDGYDKLDLSDKLGEVTILEDIEELETMNEYISDRFVCSVECEGEILLPEEVERDLNSIVNDSARSKKSVKVSKRKKRKKKK